MSLLLLSLLLLFFTYNISSSFNDSDKVIREAVAVAEAIMIIIIMTVGPARMISNGHG